MNENTNMDTQEKLKEIKRSFRLLMNGEASRSMRERGLDYHLNWGVAFTDLQKMAEEYGKDYSLAVELWKEHIRECRILATIIMPQERMTPELTDLWVEQVDTQELAERLAFNLLQYLDFAPVLAFEWIASPFPMRQICGFHVLSRRMMRGEAPDERGICEIIDQAQTALSDDSIPVKHAAYTCLMRLADLGDDYERIVNSALKSAGLDSLL